MTDNEYDKTDIPNNLTLQELLDRGIINESRVNYRDLINESGVPFELFEEEKPTLVLGTGENEYTIRNGGKENVSCCITIS